MSFINLNLDEVTIEAKHSSCEDTVNFINSKGSLESIKIEDSFSDALDIDFSEIKIKKIEIYNALNDCVDFSSGNYVWAL